MTPFTLIMSLLVIVGLSVYLWSEFKTPEKPFMNDKTDDDSSLEEGTYVPVSSSASSSDTVSADLDLTSDSIPSPNNTGTESKSDYSLTLQELMIIQTQIDIRNDKKDFPQYTATVEPVSIGMFNGYQIQERYWCSDNCPDNGIIFLAYENTNETQCDSLGGHSIYKYGWGEQYLGCSPVENKYSDVDIDGNFRI